MNVRGKVALVTGGARGLGKGYVEALLKKGAQVVFCDVLQEAGQSTEAELQDVHGKDQVTFLPADVTVQQDMEAVYKRIINDFGHIDIVINNAGIGPFLGQERTFGINLFGVVRSCELAVPRMRVDAGGRGGVIVNIASIGGIYTGNGCEMYQSSKHAVVGYSGCLGKRLEAESSGIRVMALCPGCVKTDLTKRQQEWADSGDARTLDILETFGGWVPISRVADICLQLIETDVPSGSIIKADNAGGHVVDSDNVPLEPL